MKLPKIVTIATLLAGNYCYANSWLQAELTYNQTIDNKHYPAKVSLLRPESYFMENHATKRGEKLTVNIPEMGLDNVAMTIVSIKPFKGIFKQIEGPGSLFHSSLTSCKHCHLRLSGFFNLFEYKSIPDNGNSIYKQIDEIGWTDKTNRPVTGAFRRYAKEVYSYKFRNLKTNEISTINATPNHPFYVTNKHTYIPIAEVTADDELLSQAGEAVKLECTNRQQYNCGTMYKKDNNQPTLVYNFEVYQQHRYFVGDKDSDKGILVHNPYYPCDICEKSFNGKTRYTIHKRTHTGEKPHACPWEGCSYSTGDPSTLRRHNRIHTREKSYACSEEGCGYIARFRSNLSKHELTHKANKPHVCAVEGCDFRTKYLHNLKSHIGKKHPKLLNVAFPDWDPQQVKEILDQYLEPGNVALPDVEVFDQLP